MTLDEVIEVMKQAQAEGKMLVRLHTGDPSIYGAIREQMDALDTAGIEYESCPGVSAVWCGGVLEFRIYTAGNLTVIDHYKNGGKDKSSSKGKYRKFCHASGINGSLFKYRNVSRIK